MKEVMIATDIVSEYHIGSRGSPLENDEDEITDLIDDIAAALTTAREEGEREGMLRAAGIIDMYSPVQDARQLFHLVRALALAPRSDRPQTNTEAKFSIGDAVEKFTGDYRVTGIVVGVYRTLKGQLRYVVEHYGFQHIYSGTQLRFFAAKDGG